MNERTQSAVEPDVKWLFRVGGISAFVLVIGYLVTFPIYGWVGDPPPTNVEAQLMYFAEHGAAWWAILGLMVFTDLLLAPILLSLYVALKRVNSNVMLLAIACVGLFIVLDPVLTWTPRSALITAGGHFAAATTSAEKAVFVAAAGYASAMLDSPLGGTYAILMPSLGILLAGLVMLRGVFNKMTAYVAIAVGITGIIFMGSYIADGLAVFRYINALLATAWYVFVGWRLYRLGRQ